MPEAISGRAPAAFPFGYWSFTQSCSFGRSITWLFIGAGWDLVGLFRVALVGARRTAEMLVARIIMAVAVLNLLFLFSELTMNVVRVYFG
jgi:hypothetical protein